MTPQTQTRKAHEAIGRIRASIYNLRRLADDPRRACLIADEALEDLQTLSVHVHRLTNAALGIEEKAP